MDTLGQIFVNGLIAGSGYGLVGLSFGLIYATTHFFHFAHGAVYTFAAYLAFALLTLAGLSAWISIPLAILGAAIAGGFMDVFMYRPLRNRQAGPLILLLASLGLFVVIQACVSIAFGSNVHVLSSVIAGTTFSIFGGRITSSQLITVIVANSLFFGILAALHTTRPGRILRAVGSDPELARIVGVEIDRIIPIVFGVGSALAGIAALLAAYDTGLKPTMGFNALLFGVVAMIIGGIGNVPGAYLGGLLLGFAQQFGAWILPSRWQDLIVYLILAFFLLLRPAGIAGRRSRAKV